MIVCQCNFIRESALRAAVQDGATRVSEAYKALGCKVKCGQCLPFAFEIVSEELHKIRDAGGAPCPSAAKPDIIPLRKAG